MGLKLLNIVGNNKGWAIPNRAKNLALYLKEYFDITDFFEWDLPDNCNDYDIIHMHHPVTNSKVNNITTKWGFEITSERILSKIFEMGLCEKANFVIAKNEKLLEMVYKKCKLCVLIPNGVDTELFKPEIIRVGWVGNDTSSTVYRLYKGTDLIKLACQRLNEELQGLFNIVFEKDSSCYPKIFPQEEIAKFYRSLDVFVLASKAEGSSNVVLEALSMGLPVVTTTVGNWKVLDSLGVVIPVERNINAIKEGIKRAIQDKIKRRNIMLKHYNWKNFAEQYLAIYKRIGMNYGNMGI